MRRILAALGTAAVTLGVPAGLVLATSAPASACIFIATQGAAPLTQGAAPLTCSPNGGGYTFAVTATPDITGPGDAVTANLSLTPTGGRPEDGTSHTQFSIDNGTCTGNLCVPDTAGTHTITGQYSALSATGSSISGTASTTITVLSPAYLVVNPFSINATPGQTIAYTVERALADGRILDDVSSRATVTLGGVPCPGAVCTATTTLGQQTVTATIDGLTASRDVFVQPGRAASLVVTAHADTRFSNLQPATFTAEAYDAFGNDIGDVTADSAFTIEPDGFCNRNLCYPESGGPHAVFAIDGPLTGRADIVAAIPSPHVAPTLPGGTVGVPYAQSVLTAADPTARTELGSEAPQPPGLTLGTDGMLSGTPTTAGTYTFYVEAANASGSENMPTTITIAPGTPRTPGTPPPPAPPAKPKVTISSTAILEGRSGRKALHLTVRLSVPSPTPVTVPWHTVKGTALPGRDFVWASGRLTIPAGQLTGQVTIFVIGDRKVEKNETFTVVLTRPSGATLGWARGTVLIKNDD